MVSFAGWEAFVLKEESPHQKKNIIKPYLGHKVATWTSWAPLATSAKGKYSTALGSYDYSLLQRGS